MFVAQILDDKGHEVATADPGESVASIAATLTERRIGAMPVSSPGGALVGIVSERDIVAALAESGRDVMDRPVEEIMTRRVITCTRSDHIDDLMARMTEGRMRHLPVLEGDELVGIVSIGDVVKARNERDRGRSAGAEGLYRHRLGPAPATFQVRDGRAGRTVQAGRRRADPAVFPNDPGTFRHGAEDDRGKKTSR